MTTSPTPEQSAKAILDIFKSQNCIAGDPLKISYVKAQFLENHGGAGQYAAGLMYAEDNGWLEVSPARDTAAAARDLPPAIVTHCAEQVFCFGGDGHTGATRPSTAWRFLRAAALYRRNRDGTPDRILAAITLDIDDITTA